MKILHVAVFTPNSTNVWQADGFEALGHEVIRYDYRARVTVLSSYENRDLELITLCQIEKPDIILFSKCNLMSFYVVEQCRKICKTVMWYMDGLNNFCDEVIQKFNHSDFVFCSIYECAIEAQKYCKNSVRHPCEGGFDSRIHRPVNVPKIRDIAFIGSVYDYVLPYRVELKNHINFDIIENVYGIEHSKAVSETKINLCLTNGEGVSNRLYKLLAANGFVLSMPFNTMEQDFTPGQDFIVFNSVVEAKKQIDFYLNNEDEREKIAEHGYKTVQKYNHINYAKFIIDYIRNADE